MKKFWHEMILAHDIQRTEVFRGYMFLHCSCGKVFIR